MNGRERFYRALLLCYPAEFRHNYGGEMTQFFRDLYREKDGLAFWLHLIADTAVSALQEHTHMFLNDFRFALRMMRNAPIFTLAAVLTLALGIGVNTAIFTLVNSEMLRPLPYGHPEQLVWVAEKNDRLKLPVWAASVPNYLSWKERTQTIGPLGLIGFGTFNLTGKGDPEQLPGSTISPSLFSLLEIKPILGRSFVQEEEIPGSAPVAMISEGLWKRRFAQDPALVGSSIKLNGIPHTVLGIAPASLSLLANGDVWTPLIINPAKEARLNHIVTAVGRIKPGVTVAQAQAEMNGIARRVGEQYPEVKDWGIHLVTFERWFVSDQLRTALLVLTGAVVLVLLIASANVANLLLSRAAGRQREVAIRAAIGASHRRLLRQFLTESVALSLLGGGAGLVLAIAGVRLMNHALPANLLPVPEITMDARTLLFAAAVTLTTALLFGMAPAWHAARTDMNGLLKEGGRTSTAGARLLKNGLVVAELALATVLLIGAGLLLQSLFRLQQVPVGFDPHQLQTFQLALPAAKYKDAAQSSIFYREMLQRFARIPGVQTAAVSTGIPFGAGAYNTTPVSTPGKSNLAVGASLPIDWRAISPGYFRTMAIPLLSGRDFNDQDGPRTQRVVVVSHETAQRLWGTENALGKTIRIVGSGDDYSVVGVVAGVRNTALNLDLAPAMYFPCAAKGSRVMDVVVRTQGKPEAALSDLRRALRQLDAELPMSNVRTMDEWMTSNAAPSQLNAALLSTFALLALFIAAVGIYGVLSYSVTQRRREIALRMAIGARQGDVLKLVVGEGMLLALGGLAIGLGGALVLSRALASLLFGVSGRDPATFAVVAALLAAVAAIACWVPARRAALVDPILALREE